MSVLRELMLKILLKKEVDVMAVVYATLIIKGRKTIDQVPAIIRDEVKQILKDLKVEV
uniref:CD1375 family protein n=1 Tax=Faecalibacterium prausnitzii TaxID=853 RepID=UPI004038AFE6